MIHSLLPKVREVLYEVDPNLKDDFTSMAESAISASVLTNDLGLDSPDLMMLITEMRVQFDILIETHDLPNLDHITVHDLCEFLDSKGVTP